MNKYSNLDCKWLDWYKYNKQSRISTVIWLVLVVPCEISNNRKQIKYYVNIYIVAFKKINVRIVQKKRVGQFYSVANDNSRIIGTKFNELFLLKI